MSKIDIVIPAYEPDHRLLKLLEDLNLQNIGPVIIVDDGSGERYKEIFSKASSLVEQMGGIVLTHEANRGKGRALKTAFQYVLDNDEKVTNVITADSDGQHTVECIKKIIAGIEKEMLNSLVLGVRRFDLEGIPWKSRLGNNLTKKIFAYISGVHVSDTQTGLRGIPRKYMEELINLKGERFEFEMRMLINAADRYHIIEIPIETIYDSEDNHQTHFNPVVDSFRIYRILGEKFIKFILSSCSASIIDLVFFSVICSLLEKYYPVIYVTIATVAARIISASYNYFVNYKVVFRSRDSFKTSAFKYLLLALIQMGCSAGLITIFVKMIPTGPELLLKVVIDTVLFFISYYIQQKIVFKNEEDFGRRSGSL